MAKTSEHTFGVPVELEPGVLRVTLPLPSGPRHVHTYLVRDEDGWMLVDTGLGLPETPWQEIAARLDAPVVRIFITHMHPDHVGGAEEAARVLGAPVLQGRLDYAQCERVWGSGDWPERIAGWFLRNGVPPDVTEDLIESGHVFADFVRFAWNPTLVDPGDEIAGWQVLATPGHADGHLCLYRDGVLVAGDHVLTPITPAIGLYPESRPDPLGDYVGALGGRRRARAADRVPGAPRPDRGRGRPAPTRSSPTTRSASTGPRPRSGPSRATASTSRTRCSGGSSSRSSAGSPSRRRSRISSGSSSSAARAVRTTA